MKNRFTEEVKPEDDDRKCNITNCKGNGEDKYGKWSSKCSKQDKCVEVYDMMAKKTTVSSMVPATAELAGALEENKIIKTENNMKNLKTIVRENLMECGMEDETIYEVELNELEPYTTKSKSPRDAYETASDEDDVPMKVTSQSLEEEDLDEGMAYTDGSRRVKATPSQTRMEEEEDLDEMEDDMMNEYTTAEGCVKKNCGSLPYNAHMACSNSCEREVKSRKSLAGKGTSGKGKGRTTPQDKVVGMLGNLKEETIYSTKSPLTQEGINESLRMMKKLIK